METFDPSNPMGVNLDSDTPWDDEHPNPEDTPAGEKYLSGQARMAYRLAASHSNKLMHVYGLGWFYWTGTHWAEDTKGRALRAVTTVLQAAAAEWVETNEDALAKDVKACMSASAHEGVLKLAASAPQLSADVDDLDADPYLLNVSNGTLDLRTLDLRAPRPADRITRKTKGAYLPNLAPSDNWTRFLDVSLPNTEVRDMLQRYVGQALVGRTLEQKLLILTGRGGNGKSVWTGAIEFALGDYAITPQADMVLSKKHEGAFDGSVELRGRRWAVFSEVDKGRELAPATLKRLTGNDRITARQLYSKNITFSPSHSFAMVANHLPEVPDASRGMWRRLRVVPFDQEIAEEDQDQDLPMKLEAEADTVLTWAVMGWSDYSERGLAEPQSVLAATDSYQQKSDQLSRFLADCTTTGSIGTLNTTNLFALYEQWLGAASESSTYTRNKLSEAMKERGYDNRGKGHLWRKGNAPLMEVQGWRDHLSE